MIFIAASTSRAFRSGILVVRDLADLVLGDLADLLLLRDAGPFCRPAAFLISSGAGGSW